MKYWKVVKTQSKEFSVKIELDEENNLLESSTCCCEWGSYHRYSKQNEEYWICRHILQAYAEVMKMSPLKAKNLLVTSGKLPKDHLRRI